MKELFDEIYTVVCSS